MVTMTARMATTVMRGAAMMRKLFDRIRSRQGSLLVAVLWSLFFMASLALVINTLITPQLTLAGKLRDRVILRHIAEAGVKRAIVEIRADETEGYDMLNDPWGINEDAFKEIELDDGRFVSVKYTTAGTGEDEGEEFYGLSDEESKININTATVDVLEYMFEELVGTTSQEASDLADAIIDWRDEDDEPEDNGAEDSYYEGLSEGYSAKNANFDILEELLLVKGFSKEIYDQVAPYLTVYGNGKVNLNTAGVTVMECLGMRTSLAENVIAYREGDDGRIGTEDDREFNSAGDAPALLSSKISLNAEELNEFTAIAEGDLVDVISDNFRGISYGALQEEELQTHIEFVINRDEEIRFWKEL